MALTNKQKDALLDIQAKIGDLQGQLMEYWNDAGEGEAQVLHNIDGLLETVYNMLGNNFG